jgi:hypothetical protein
MVHPPRILNACVASGKAHKSYAMDAFTQIACRTQLAKCGLP